MLQNKIDLNTFLTVNQINWIQFSEWEKYTEKINDIYYLMNEWNAESVTFLKHA